MAKITNRFEVIMVEDCGQDQSWEIIVKMANEDKMVRGIKLSRNFGQHNAILCGIREAQYDVIVTMDDDLQHPVCEIKKILAKLNEGFDVVYGFPEKQKHNIFRNLASKITKIALQSAIGVNTAKNISAFRAFRTNLRKGFEQYSSPFVSIDVLLTWSTTKFSVVKVMSQTRVIGNSNYTLGKLIRHAFNMMTGFSTLPLQIASILGFGSTFFGVGVLVYVLSRYLFEGSSVQGFPFLASIIAIFSGVQLFTFGIFGEYLARIHFRTMKRPAYVIREKINSEENKV